MRIITTQRDGLVVIYTTTSGGEPTQRAAIDAGEELGPRELAKITNELADHFPRWNDLGRRELAAPARAKAPRALPAATLTRMRPDELRAVVVEHIGAHPWTTARELGGVIDKTPSHVLDVCAKLLAAGIIQRRRRGGVEDRAGSTIPYEFALAGA